MLKQKLFLWALVALVIALCSFNTLAYYQRDVFKEIVFDDFSNDDAIELTPQELIKRSGFDYEEYYVIANDGYVSQLVRLINPLADRNKLKWPPVLVFHGGNTDISCYLLASSIQHHPEKYPRSPDTDEPITSSNRSLGFMLANNGYDTWLIGTRGSNEQNQAYVEDVAAARSDPDFRPDDSRFRLVREDPETYFSYGLDEIIKHELHAQIDKVRQLTNSEEVFIFCFSLSATTLFPFMAENPDYAIRVRHFALMAPAIAADHFTTVGKVYFEQTCPKLPTRGTGFTPTYFVKPIIREAVKQLSKSGHIKYTLIYSVVTCLFGPSLKYHTNLERNLLARVFQPVSFKSIQQYCQQSVSKQLTKFDYGTEGNLAKYGQATPPVYKADRLEVQNWAIIAGTYDALADPTTIQRLIETTESPEPVKLIVALGFNHVDFFGAVENDKYVNLPYLAELDKHSDF